MDEYLLGTGGFDRCGRDRRELGVVAGSGGGFLFGGGLRRRLEHAGEGGERRFRRFMAMIMTTRKT